ncbi:nucleoside diphosphate kinase regulator [Azospirillum sp. RWY-5-1]|uniref:Nucleoside diphosphate kinase regulator n=1 Tax=Azospirillum oleiclasticum TaxID=2735135 RepID=A0ABX2TFB1_9PROT|nr:nucleoside diphosphate kinase regulator [Azospirillum oleiclasticum]NYZ15077.1 nucleoside diphosphate kinase regulator [Azospirillum oleiclasticum]NYZ22839.1 nucleoside diphosphate kinase regulator [Azospirillum oleiclasticum]
MRSAEPFPAITLTAADHSRLSALVETVADTAPDVYDYLSRELDRAAVTEVPDIAPSIVTMNAEVTFRDESTGQCRRITLVYPGEADLENGRLSILTPIGAALIGVAEGRSIRWYDRQGEARTLTVLEVERGG